jgi:hypothetical protein
LFCGESGSGDCSYFSTIWEADLVAETSATFLSESGSDDGRIPDFPCISGGDWTWYPCVTACYFVNPDLILDFPVVYFLKIPDLVRSIADLLFHLDP